MHFPEPAGIDSAGNVTAARLGVGFVAGDRSEEVLRIRSARGNDLSLVSVHHTKTGEDELFLIGCVDTVDIALVSLDSCCMYEGSWHY
jgi:hypothetical protein